ncbi:myosin light chain kinase, smooth muscle-like [Chelonus insularis]|uniref:myosin light chain kinase, smooth muscle-like n=1 Tax=Chelonus insularis TaxID=460826 RepID=UPI0015886AE6|nr:myosin light chain kinase, smooth muscle-like [Chelonus insularis]
MIHVDESDPVGEIEPAFPYRDVTVRRESNFTNNYDLELELGRGKFGTVYLCKDKRNDLRLAVKIVNITKKEDRRSVEREVEIMRRLQHPRLIQLYDAVDTKKQFYVVLELIEGGELFERVIDDDFVLTERSCAVFMRQICEGIEFVHSQNILHLDLKPENILCLTKEGNRIKIIDFGLARLYDPKKKLQVLFGTPEFVAPEVVNFDEIGFGTDMWSIGVICYVLLSGLSPFMGDTDIETMANVTIAKYDFDHEAFANISEEAKDFIRCLLVKNKEKRGTASQCRNHPWLIRKKEQRTASFKKKKQLEETQLSNSKQSIISPIKNDTKNKGINKKQQVPENSLKGNNELDVTKDNLKIFVERWRDHPNSPYMMENNSPDLDSLAIARSSHQVSGSVSLRGQSPSPPESICSFTSEISESSSLFDNNYRDNNKSSFLDVVGFSCFDRRASEGFTTKSDFLHQSQQYQQHYSVPKDQLSKMLLAENIIKLSDQLRSQIYITSADKTTDSTENHRCESISSVLSTTGKSKLSIPNNNAKGSSSVITRTKTTEKNSIVQNKQNNNQVNEITEKLMSLSRNRKLNGTKFNGNKSYDEQKTVNSTGFTQMKPSIKITDAENNNQNIDLTPPWRRSKIKHRFSETCRDVPRIYSLQNIHKSITLDEQATSAKDLLLQLLDVWEEKQTMQLGVRSKSISIDRSDEESIARKSINTLAEYFQSVQQCNKQPIDTDSDD